MGEKGLSLREAFRGFGPRKEALHREVDINEEEWETLADLKKGAQTETQLEATCFSDLDLRALLCGLLRKGYITALDGVPGSEPAYVLTELGSTRLAILMERFDAMLAERMLLMDPDDIRATLRTIEVFMARNGISPNPPRRRFH